MRRASAYGGSLSYLLPVGGVYSTALRRSLSGGDDTTAFLIRPVARHDPVEQPLEAVFEGAFTVTLEGRDPERVAEQRTPGSVAFLRGQPGFGEKGAAGLGDRLAR